MKKKHSFVRGCLVVALLLALPVTASAHTAISGVGDFFGGVLHPLTTPIHVLVLLGLGLLAGQRSPLNLKVPLAVFIPVSALALLLTTTGLVKTVYPPLLIGIALVAGVLVALEKPLPTVITAVVFALAALALGLDSAVESGTPPSIVKTLLGTWVGLVLAVADIAYYLSFFTKQKWQQVGIRVAGSWVTAASFMILAFALRR
ncbi:MAG TPA: HupE/UreJ family protein [Verrucomicrobiae bacterium]|nr:HupE/UreJ family protein [Verrucomicrobiae bacterium]